MNNQLIAIIKKTDQVQLEQATSGNYGTLSSDVNGVLSWVDNAANPYWMVPAPVAGDDGLVLIYDHATTSFTYNSPDAAHVHKLARKGSVGTITRGTPVRVTGYNIGGGFLEVEAADAASAATMPAIGLAEDDITNGADGYVVVVGNLTDFDTSSYSVTDQLYVASGGGLTVTPPTGTAERQKIGQVLRSNVATGEILVLGAGRTNAVPNIPNGQAWIGNGSGVATPTTLATVATSGDYNDLSNTPGGIVTVSASKTLALSDNLTYQDVVAAATITVPPQVDVVWPAKVTIPVLGNTASTVTIASGAGVTITSKDSLFTLDGLGASAVLIRTGENAWFLTGDLV